MKNTSWALEGQLLSLASFRADVLEAIASLTSLFRVALRRAIHTRNPEAAERILKSVKAVMDVFDELAAAANVRLSIAHGKPELLAYFAENHLCRPRPASPDEWLASTFEVLRRTGWLNAKPAKVTHYLQAGARLAYKAHYLDGGYVRPSDALHYDPRRNDADTEDAPRREVLSIDDALLRAEMVAVQPCEALLERQYVEQSVAELRAAVEGNPALATYTEAIIRDPYRTRREIWRSLGWPDRKGQSVDKAFRRVRSEVRIRSGVRQHRALGGSELSLT